MSSPWRSGSLPMATAEAFVTRYGLPLTQGLGVIEVGLPLLNNFVGEFLVLQAAMQVNFFYALFAAVGVILSAVYMLWMVQRVLFGPLRHDDDRRARVDPRPGRESSRLSVTRSAASAMPQIRK